MADWSAEARCAGIDPELFFPVGGGRAAIAQIEDARSYCDACSVRMKCFSFALTATVDYGIWAGTTPEERVAMRRRVGIRRPRRTSAVRTTQVNNDPEHGGA